MVTFSEQSATSAAAARPSTTKGSGNLVKIILGIIAAVIVLGGGYYFWQSRGIRIATGDYQAVFLTNNQVYFGKIHKSTANEVILSDVYYMIIRRPVQSQVPQATPAAQQRPEYTLIKLGGELHGPTDEMRINREHVLFIEALKGDGKVVQAIEQSKNQP